MPLCVCHFLLDEGVCIFLECSSDNESTREEVRNKAMHAARKILPDETTNGILPGFLVVCIQANSKTKIFEVEKILVNRPFVEEKFEDQSIDVACICT